MILFNVHCLTHIIHTPYKVMGSLISSAVCYRWRYPKYVTADEAHSRARADRVHVTRPAKVLSQMFYLPHRWCTCRRRSFDHLQL